MLNHDGGERLGSGVCYQNVQTGGFEKGDLVSNGERGEAREPLGKLHNLDDALGGQLAELVPQAQVQLHPVVGAGVLGEARQKLMHGKPW